MDATKIGLIKQSLKQKNRRVYELFYFLWVKRLKLDLTNHSALVLKKGNQSLIAHSDHTRLVLAKLTKDSVPAWFSLDIKDRWLQIFLIEIEAFLHIFCVSCLQSICMTVKNCKQQSDCNDGMFCNDKLFCIPRQCSLNSDCNQVWFSLSL